VDRVTIGFSITNQCSSVRPGCQATSTIGRQVAHCEGQTGACAVSIEQQFLSGICGRRTNYAVVFYECVPGMEAVFSSFSFINFPQFHAILKFCLIV
jgi:hypothetical protein